MRLAVADGATECMFAGIWARLLVKAFGRGRMSAPNTDFQCLSKLGGVWQRTIARRAMPWYVEEKIRQGAFSTLLGFELHPQIGDDDGEWCALAVGDSTLKESFPLGLSDEFGNQPDLLGTATTERNPQLIRRMSGRWKLGDKFYLMTDALACWFLKRRELLLDDDICKIEDQPAFQRLIESERQKVGDLGTHMMRNDDVTLVRCSV